MIYLVESFYSIQGEGKYIGSPSLFFRFGGCNMRCEGFGCTETIDGEEILGCDTIHAVDKKHFSHTWQKIDSTKQLIEILNSYSLPHATDIILTGGEPLIYADDEIFVTFLEELHSRGHKICFETNGSLNVDFEKHKIYKECHFALSVKLENSGESLKKRINSHAINNITSKAKDAFFKFSVACEDIGENLSSEIEMIISHAKENAQVYCMPMGDNKEDVEKNSHALIEYCKTKGYNFSDRLHIRIWDKKKGI